MLPSAGEIVKRPRKSLTHKLSITEEHPSQEA